MEERFLFILNNDITDETVLAVLAALQAFIIAAKEKNNAWNRVHHDTRTLDIKSYFVCQERYAFIFQQCLPTIEGIYSSLDFIPKIDFTFVADISITAAYELSKHSSRPLAQALGILLGCEASTLADVSNLQKEFVQDTNNLLDFNIDKYLEDSGHTLIKGNGHIVSAHNFLDTPYDLVWRINEVYRAKTVIGYSSFETYLGCCLHKPVFEVQTNPHLFKWSNSNYSCVTVADNDAIIKGVKLCLDSIKE